MTKRNVVITGVLGAVFAVMLAIGVMGGLLRNVGGAIADLEKKNNDLGILVYQQKIELEAKDKELRDMLNKQQEATQKLRDRQDAGSKIYEAAEYLAYLEVDVTLKNSWLDSMQRLYEMERQGKLMILELNEQGQTARFLLSGFAIKDNYVVTAGHIRDGAYVINKITVYFNNDQVADYNLRGYDSKLDVAVLAPKYASFKYKGSVAELGKSSELKVGQTVIALGAPIGERKTFSEGPINNLEVGSDYPGKINASFTQKQLIMHHADIDAGNSGGPLLNTDGEVVGINIMILRNYNSWMLAVPIDDAKIILDDLKKGLQR